PFVDCPGEAAAPQAGDLDSVEIARGNLGLLRLNGHLAGTRLRTTLDLDTTGIIIDQRNRTGPAGGLNPRQGFDPLDGLLEEGGLAARLGVFGSRQQDLPRQNALRLEAGINLEQPHKAPDQKPGTD